MSNLSIRDTISGSVSIGKVEQGIQGDKGDKGEQGLSAYEIWLSQGNEGTEQDFLNSLKGEKGDKGERGDRGEQGLQGEQGLSGSDGLSAYEVWLSLGNVGTEQDFINSLKGEGADVDLSEYVTTGDFTNLKIEIEDARGENQFLVDRLDYIDSDIQTINSHLEDMASEIEELKEGNIEIDLADYAKKTELSSKVDKVDGKGLSTNDYTTAEKNKLAGLSNYTHPSSHSASMITEDSTHRFVTDSEKSSWNNKSNFSGNYNDLTNKPTIPTKTSQLTDDVGFAKQSEVDGLSEEIADQQTGLNAHTSNTTIHVTSAEKQVWNNKANKTDIPTITQEAGESESLVMSQKAVTDLVNEAVREATKIEYETVDSIEEMTDTSKQYVLSTDGYIYMFTETTETVTHEAENKFVPSDAQINKRMGSSTISAKDGFVWSGAIPVDLTKETPFRVKVEGTKIVEDTSEQQKLWLCSDINGQTKISAAVIMTDRENSPSYTVLLDDGTIYVDYLEGKRLSDSIITSTKSIRIGFKFSDSAIASTSALSGVKITIPSEAYTEEVTTSKWVSTEMKPSASGNGVNYVDLLVKVNQNKTDIEEANKRITALASGSEVLTVPSFWQSAVAECIAKIKAVQVGRNCVTFPFFSDNHQRNGYAGTLIGYIMRECNIPYCFFGGDAISNGSDVTSEAIMIAQDKAFDDMMSVIPPEKMCRALGNHDAYWNPTPDSGSSTRVYYTREQIYDLFLRQESVSQNKHYGGDGTFYYVDDIASKTRFVVCNMNVNANTTTEKLDNTQLEWLENEAMVFDESGWGLVFISHQPITNHYHSNIYTETASAIQTLLTNYANGTNTNKADIVGWFAGHIHCDRIYTGVASNTSDDTVKNALPWKTVTVRADATNLCRDRDLAHTVANDDKSHAIDFVTINRKTRTVKITRLGIGEDREFTF